MIKFFKILFSKLIKRKKKKESLGYYLMDKQAKSELPPGIEVVNEGDGIFKVISDEELSLEEIRDIIKMYIKEQENG